MKTNRKISQEIFEGILEANGNESFKEIQLPPLELNLTIKPKVKLLGGRYTTQNKSWITFDWNYDNDALQAELDHQIKQQVLAHIKKHANLPQEELNALENDEPGSWSLINLLNNISSY